MTVVVLRLSGLPGGDAEQAACALLDDYRTNPDLTRLLVIDDTDAILGHSAVYERLLTAHRLDHLVCVAVGPRAGGGKEFWLPGNIGSGQGSAVLWVSDPEGIDWRLAPAANAVGHTGNSVSGLDHLSEVLSVDEVFDRVCDIARSVPGGVASPGFRLAGADDEAASFTAALAAAVRRITAPDTGVPGRADEPFTVPLTTPAGAVTLTESGELSRYRDDVIADAASASEAVGEWAGMTGLLDLSPPDVQVHVTGVGAALGRLRDRVARLLEDANAPGGLTQKQRAQLAAAGLRIPDPVAEIPGRPAGDPGGEAPEAVFGRSPVHQAIADAIKDGDALPGVKKRLNLTMSTLDHGGSARYLPEVDQLCPGSLLRQLAAPPPPPRSRRPWLLATVILAALLGAAVGRQNLVAGVAVAVVALAGMTTAIVWSWRVRVASWRRQLALDEAVHAADALTALITTVAAREWAGDSVTHNEIARIRIALDGVVKELTEHGDAGGGARTPQAARLADSLMPGLRALVLAGLAAGSASAADGGKVSFQRARDETRRLLTDWTTAVREHGTQVRPRFATFAAHDISYADVGEVAEISAAIQYDPRESMWQLCRPADLSALDMTGAVQVVAFAPRLVRQRLADVLPQDTVWTSSGAHAGLLRLVPLRPGITSVSWPANVPGEVPR